MSDEDLSSYCALLALDVNVIGVNPVSAGKSDTTGSPRDCGGGSGALAKVFSRSTDGLGRGPSQLAPGLTSSSESCCHAMLSLSGGIFRKS